MGRRQRVQAQPVEVFSSNYALYGEMSARVMATLAQWAPVMEVYSIDEAFLDLTDLATEDLVYMLEGMGVKTGVDLEKLADAGELAQKILGKKLPGRYLQACLSSRVKNPS